jgi:hypothetical protein
VTAIAAVVRELIAALADQTSFSAPWYVIVESSVRGMRGMVGRCFVDAERDCPRQLPTTD